MESPGLFHLKPSYSFSLIKECSSLSDQAIKITEYENNVAISTLKVKPNIPDSFGKSTFKDSTFYKECKCH